MVLHLKDRDGGDTDDERHRNAGTEERSQGP
jgi:hypothetical protein